jgi:DNA-directed RNA polymerase subunit M/transcription elongation factor TFIIS
MTSDEMKSEERKKEEEKIKKDNMNNAMVAQEEVSISASLQCGKCGQKKVSYTQAQTRSADEPMTTYAFPYFHLGRKLMDAASVLVLSAGTGGSSREM